MATTAQQRNFINAIAPLIQKYAKKNGYKVASPIIAQACLESAYGTSSLASKFHNYFGMKCGSSWKGAYVSMGTKEEYTPGKLTDIKAKFRAYNNMEEGVKGYFDFISAARYKNLKTAKDPKDYLTKIKADGYATSSAYVTNNMNVVLRMGLTKYDNFVPDTPEPTPAPEPKPTPTPAPKKVSYYSKYTGTSNRIDTVLKAIGVPSTSIGTPAKRSPIAAANGYKNYSGKTDENLALIALAKKGKLVKP